MCSCVRRVVYLFFSWPVIAFKGLLLLNYFKFHLMFQKLILLTIRNLKMFLKKGKDIFLVKLSLGESHGEIFLLTPNLCFQLLKMSLLFCTFLSHIKIYNKYYLKLHKFKFLKATTSFLENYVKLLRIFYIFHYFTNKACTSEICAEYKDLN